MTDKSKDDFASLELKGWSKQDVAQSYARDFAQAAQQCVPALVTQARVKPGDSALDLCCGHGIVAEGLVMTGARVTGLDFSPAMLDMARTRVPNAEFVEGDAMNLPFDDAAYSAVTIGFGMPHVPEPPRVMAEARRVLQTGGRLSYSVWQGEDADSALDYVFQAIGVHGDPSIKLPPGPGASDYGIRDVATPALRAAGFGDIEFTIVPSRWQVDDPATPYDFFLEGTVRGGSLLRPQPQANAQAIRQAVVYAVQSRHGTTGPWTIPIPAVVVSATAV